MGGTGTGTRATGTSSAGGLVTPPAIEPVSLQDMKNHLRLDSGSFTDNLTTVQSLAYGSKAVQNNYTVHVGTGIDVLGKQAVAILHAGTNGATGTNDTRIEESDQLATGYTAWTGGAFAQITAANDNADYKLAYTGSKQYIRTASKILLAACEFGTSIETYSSDTTEDDLLTALITAARQQVEAITQRALITQTWDLFLDEFPDYDERKPYIALPFGNLQSVTSVAYTDSDGTVTTMDVTDDYLVNANSEPGRICLPYGASWPSFTAHPVNPIAIRYTAGYGATAASVPAAIRTALKMIAESLYNDRSATHSQVAGNITENKAVMSLLYPFRLWGF